MQTIGIDTGGTFTDTVVLRDDGRVGVGKALTTHEDLKEGVLASLAVAAGSLGMTPRDVLADTGILAHGTTVGLNALLTDSGAKVGLLVTAGFESTLPIARANKVHGLPAEDAVNALRWRKPRMLVPRERIAGVRERIDTTGSVVVPLDEAQARAAIRALLSRGAEAIGIALLWSPVNDAHERRLAELVAEEAPGMHVTLSSALAPRVGEYERMATVAMNAFVAPLVGNYLASLSAAMAGLGFGGEFLIVTMGGGVRRAASLRDAPVHLLQSGPVGGIMAAQRLGADLGHRNVLATDVGGTSFDVGLVVDGALPGASRPRIDRHGLAVPVIDLGSIGTGGGSIASIDPALGVLRVGPQSAGSRPGPACYGLGGTQPTVTDAAAVLGYLDRLGGSLTLDVAAARRAMEPLAAALGLDVHAAADGVLRVASAQMADLVRRCSVQRGQDPRKFVLYAYGGAAPQHVGRYAADLGVRSIVIPRLGPQFSAWGAASGDMRSFWEIEFPARRFRDHAGHLEETFAGLERQALAEFGEVPRAAGRTVLRRSVGLKFTRQLHRIDVPVGAGPLTAQDARAAEAAFRERYEQIVGRGSAYADSAIDLAAVSVEAVVPAELPQAHARRGAGRLAARAARPAWFGGGHVDTPVYDWDALPGEAEIAGPAFIESEQTTVVVYPGQSARLDAAGNICLAMPPAAARGAATVREGVAA